MDMNEAMDMLGIKICPSCGKEYLGHPAISRKDNKTLICSDCGVKEAIQQYLEHISTKEVKDDKAH